MPVYKGSRLRWWLRPLRRRVHPAVAWYRHRAIEPVDVVVASYPRSGKTWLTIMLAELLTDQRVDLLTADRLTPAVGDHRGAPLIVRGSGRLLKSHESYRGEYRKCIYVVRDVRDVLVSYFNYRKWLSEYSGELSEFVKLCLAGKVDTYGAWPEHVASWLNAETSGVFVVRFEDIRRDPTTSLGALMSFLGVDTDPSVLASVADRNSVSHMRTKTESAFGDSRSGGGFVREGRTGGWQEHLSAADLALIEQRAGEVMERLGYVTLSVADGIQNRS